RTIMSSAADALALARGDLDEAAELLDRLLVVVHLEAEHRVVVQPDATIFLDDEHRGGLHAACVTARRLAGLERGEQSERQVTLRLLERAHHLVHDRLAGEDVALGGAVRARLRARLVAGPGARLRARERRDVALRIDDGELPALLRPVVRARVRVRLPHAADYVGGCDALLEQRNRLRAVAHVDDRLCRDGADAGLCPEHAVADGEDARLDGAADFAGGRVVAENGEGGDGVAERDVRGLLSG